MMGLGIERDKFFTPKPLEECRTWVRKIS
jgi:hypothetical protein